MSMPASSGVLSLTSLPKINLSTILATNTTARAMAKSSSFKLSGSLKPDAAQRTREETKAMAVVAIPMPAISAKSFPISFFCKKLLIASGSRPIPLSTVPKSLSLLPM